MHPKLRQPTTPRNSFQAPRTSIITTDQDDQNPLFNYYASPEDRDQTDFNSEPSTSLNNQ